MANFANLGGPNVKLMGQAELSRLIVKGRGAHIATALTSLGWSKGPAVTILAKFENGQVEGSRYEAIGSLKGVEIPLKHLDGDSKDGVAVIDMSDLSKFTQMTMSTDLSLQTTHSLLLCILLRSLKPKRD